MPRPRPKRSITEAVRNGAAAGKTLTRRQREVLAALARGRKLADIARQLGITAKTVERHKTRIMAKLSIHDTATLVRYAIWIGLIPVWDEPPPDRSRP